MCSAEQVSGRDRILEEAAALFVRQGYRETTLRDIAAAAGMKAGSIYYHFDAKDELLAAVLETGIARITRSFEETAASLPDDVAPSERLRRHVHAHLAALFEHGPFTTSHVTVFHAAPEAVRALGTPSRDAYERCWSELLADLQRSGHLRAGIDLGLHRILLLGAANATLDWFDPTGDRTLDELATALTEQFWQGVGTPIGTLIDAPAPNPSTRAAARRAAAPTTTRNRAARNGTPAAPTRPKKEPTP
ncbi:MAG: TetR/AcrR family transcriptional regulator [Acidimicrobiia bacterium]